MKTVLKTYGLVFKLFGIMVINLFLFSFGLQLASKNSDLSLLSGFALLLAVAVADCLLLKAPLDRLYQKLSQLLKG